MSLLLECEVGGAYAQDKIPQQDFALEMQGGLMREGGLICETLW